MDVTVAAPDADADGAPARSGRRLSAAARRSKRAASRCITKANTKAILGDGKVEGVELADGTIAPGRPRRHGGRHPAQRGARQGRRARRSTAASSSTTDMRTSDPDIFALGECAEHRGQCYGLVAPLYEMATRRRRAARRRRRGALHAGSSRSTKLKVTGIDLFSAGDFADGDGPRGDRAARRRARRLQAPRAQGQPHHRRGAVRRDGRRRLVLRPAEEAAPTSPRCATR